MIKKNLLLLVEYVVKVYKNKIVYLLIIANNTNDFGGY